MQKKLSKKTIVTVCLAIAICIIPIVFMGISILKQLPSAQWWGRFSYTNILFLFSDFFSPILTNNVNAPPIFFYNKHLTLWLLLPTLIGTAGLLLGVKRNKGIFTVCFLTILVLTVLAYSGKIVFITKYAIEILPAFIVMISCEYDRLKKFGIILFSLLISFHLASFFTPYYVTKIIRTEGHRLPCEILNKQNSDVYIFTYYSPDRFKRYSDINGKTLEISKINRFDYADNPSKILNNVKSGEKISVLFLDSVSFFPEEIIELNKNNKKIPEMFITFSHIRNELTKEIKENYRDINMQRSGNWTVISGLKK